jgi:hypothetical protein
VASDLPEGTGSSEASRSAATSMDSTPTAASARVPWRSIGTGAVSIGTPLSAAILHPLFGEVTAVVELIVILTVLGTALFGSQTLSERAFRLMRWLGNRPEPPGPRLSS